MTLRPPDSAPPTRAGPLGALRLAWPLSPRGRALRCRSACARAHALGLAAPPAHVRTLWVLRYNPKDAPDRHARRAMETENKKLRAKARTRRGSPGPPAHAYKPCLRSEPPHARARTRVKGHTHTHSRR